MAHPCHELPRIRASIGGELVAGMAQVVNVKAAPHAAPLARRQRRCSALGGPRGARRATRNVSRISTVRPSPSPDIARGRLVRVWPVSAGRQGRYRRASVLGTHDQAVSLFDRVTKLGGFAYGLGPFSEVDDRVDRVLVERGEDGDGS